MFKALPFFCACAAGLSAAALTLPQALREALQANPGYLAARSDTRYYDAARDSGAAGYLPTLAASGGYSASWLNTHQQRVGASPQDWSMARSSAGNAGVNLDWTLFQGFTGPLSTQRLRLQFEQAQIVEGKSREDLIRNVALAYANVARQMRLRQALDTSLKISQERVRIIERSLVAGAVSRSEVLSTRVDLNADRSALLRQEADLESARLLLGQLLGRKKPVEEDVDTASMPSGPLELEALLREVPAKRTDVRLAESNRALADVAARQRAVLWWPRLDALAGYNFALTQSEASQILNNRTLGPTVGLQLNFNLFTGELPWNGIKRARMAVTSAELRQQDVLAVAETEVRQNHAGWLAADSALALDREGLGFARENLRLTFSRWQAGSLAYLDARHAQEQYLDAVTRTESTAFDAFKSRLDLLKAAGRLETLISPISP